MRHNEDIRRRSNTSRTEVDLPLRKNYEFPEVRYSYHIRNVRGEKVCSWLGLLHRGFDDGNVHKLLEKRRLRCQGQPYLTGVQQEGHPKIQKEREERELTEEAAPL